MGTGMVAASAKMAATVQQCLHKVQRRAIQISGNDPIRDREM